MPPIIIHIDMDAFFASVEQRDNAAYRGKPVIVGSDPKGGRGRGVVSTCSYEARAFGIHSAMAISIAFRKCPHGIFVKPDMEKYAAVSKQIYDIFHDFTPKVEMISIDEAFLDITGAVHLHDGSAVKLCKVLKKEIFDKTGLTASVGLSTSKLVSKIASDLQKPDGLVVVKRGTEKEFLAPLDISRISGLGKIGQEKLRALGINLIGDIAGLKLSDLRNIFSESADYLYNCSMGIDDRGVVNDEEIKSVSHEYTFEQDVSSRDDIVRMLMHLCEKTTFRLAQHKMRGRTITLKVRTSDFKTIVRSRTLHMLTNSAQDIFCTALELYDEFTKTNIFPVRLIGVKIANFNMKDEQIDLFESKKREKNESLGSVVHEIKKKFGFDSIFHAVRKK